MRYERNDKLRTDWVGLKARGLPSGVNALILLLIVASLAALVMACGEDPVPTPAPTAAVAPAPTATTAPAPTTAPAATAVPAPTATTAPTPTQAPAATAVPAPTPTAVPAPTPTKAPTAPTVAPTPTAAPTPAPVELDDEALTLAYVERAIEFYKENGLEATVEFYQSDAGIEDGRHLTLIDKAENVLLVYRPTPTLQGQYVGPGSPYTGLGQLVSVATDEGFWGTARGINLTTRLEEPRRILTVLYDGYVFTSSHSALIEDVAASTQEYVEKAVAKYDSDGLDAVIAHYNSTESLDGQFYLFLIGADDLYLAHPIFSHLIGSDIKDVVGSDGQELGKEIAEASEEGIWVEYLWPHPVSRKEQQKVTWAVRHDGLIFASGYYAGEPETGPPAWRGADPREYTEEYVHRAVERYERDGLESMLNYYNSVASFEGEWYLFATDDTDIYHVHPLVPQLIGTDIKEIVGPDDYRLGEALAKATEEGIWVDYLWPHPVTLKQAPKASYAVRRDGMLFASGYYVQIEDPVARTKSYVQRAIHHYDENGLEATLEHYSSEDSFDVQWSLLMADEELTLLLAPVAKHLEGTNLHLVFRNTNRQAANELAAATEEGAWITYIRPNVRSSETLYAHMWAVRHDGLIFMSRYFDDQPEDPE